MRVIYFYKVVTDRPGRRSPQPFISFKCFIAMQKIAIERVCPYVYHPKVNMNILLLNLLILSPIATDMQNINIMIIIIVVNFFLFSTYTYLPIVAHSSYTYIHIHIVYLWTAHQQIAFFYEWNLYETAMKIVVNLVFVQLFEMNSIQTNRLNWKFTVFTRKNSLTFVCIDIGCSSTHFTKHKLKSFVEKDSIFNCW